MQVGPSNFNLVIDSNTMNVYVIIENMPEVPFNAQNCRIIGVTRSLDVANRYAGPNRIIKGPVPFFDDFTPPEIIRKQPTIFPTTTDDAKPYSFPRITPSPLQFPTLTSIDKVVKPTPTPFPNQPVPFPPYPSTYMPSYQQGSSLSADGRLMSPVHFDNPLFADDRLMSPIPFNSSLFRQSSSNSNMNKMDIDK